MFQTRRGKTYGLPKSLAKRTEPVVHEGEGQLAPGMMAKTTTPTTSPKAGRLPMPYHVEEGELSLLALTSMTFPHPEAVVEDAPRRAYSDVLRKGLGESKSPKDAIASPAFESTKVLEQDDPSRKAPEGAGEPSTRRGNGIGNDDPERTSMRLSSGPSPNRVLDAYSAHAGAVEPTSEGMATPDRMVEAKGQGPTPRSDSETGMPGSYPARDPSYRPASPILPSQPTIAPSSGSHVVSAEDRSRTPSPTQEDFVTAQGGWSVSQSRLRVKDVPTASVVIKPRFFPHKSLVIESVQHEMDIPEKSRASGAPERAHTQAQGASARLLRQQKQARRHAEVIRKHLESEEAAKREEDNHWMEVVSRLGDKSGEQEPRNPAKQPRLNHTFEWEQPGHSVTTDFDDILKRFSDRSDSETNGGRKATAVSSTPHPMARKPRAVRVNAIAVEIESDEDRQRPGPSFWDKGKWPEDDINEVRRKQKAQKKATERQTAQSEAEADDEGDDDDDDNYRPPEHKPEKQKKPSKARYEPPSAPQIHSSKAPKEPERRSDRAERSHKEGTESRLKSKGVTIADVSLAKSKRPEKEKRQGRRSETPKYLGGYLATNHSIREMPDTEDADEVSSDDGAGRAIDKAKGKDKKAKGKTKERKGKKRSQSTSQSSESSSDSSNSSSTSSSSSSSSGSSTSSRSSASSNSSDSSSSSESSDSNGKSARRRRKRTKQKEAARKYKKLRKQIKRQSRSGWKAKQPTPYSGAANFDVFEQWVFEVDLWMHDTGFKKLEAVRHVGGFLTGKAASWYMNEVATNLREYKQMWKLYQELFEHCFPFNYKQTLRERFHSAVQGNRTVKDYMRELRLYDKRLGDLSEREVRQRLWDGVHLYIRLKWTENGLNPEDSTLAKMVKTALRYERAEQMRVQETKKAEKVKSDYTRSKLTKPDKARNSRARSRSPDRTKGHSKDTRESKPREKKFERTEKADKPGKSSKPEKPVESTERRLTPEEKEQYRAEGRCFKCGITGHKNRDCPKKNKAKPTKISSSAVRLKAMDDLVDAVDRLECSATKIKATKATKEQAAKAIERNASVVKDLTRRVPKTITVEVLINGEPASAMLDTGSQSDLMSSTLADQLKLPKTRLGNPLCLQMAVTGSKSSINYSATVELQYQGIKSNRTFDIANIDSYDLVLGMPFLVEHQVTIRVSPPGISIGSTVPVPLKLGENTVLLRSAAAEILSEKLDVLREEMREKAEDLCKTAGETNLPPMRAINHRIPIIDETKRYSKRGSRVAEALRPLWVEKHKTYSSTGRWRHSTGTNATPMLCIPKQSKDGKTALRTVFDLRERNANTRKLASPLPDIEDIFSDVLRHPFRSLTVNPKCADNPHTKSAQKVRIVGKIRMLDADVDRQVMWADLTSAH